jgi:hypothetical protein
VSGSARGRRARAHALGRAAVAVDVDEARAVRAADGDLVARIHCRGRRQERGAGGGRIGRRAPQSEYWLRLGQDAVLVTLALRLPPLRAEPEGVSVEPPGASVAVVVPESGAALGVVVDDGAGADAAEAVPRAEARRRRRVPGSASIVGGG